jgi:hypothetical protein
MNKMNFSTGLDRQVFSSEELKMATKKELKMEPKKTIIVEKNSRQSIIDRITSQKEITGEMKLQTTAQIVGRSAGR